MRKCCSSRFLNSKSFLTQLHYGLIISLSFLVPQNSIAQLDSLFELVNRLPLNEQKAETWYAISRNYAHNFPDRALLYADSAIELSKKLNFKRGQGLGLFAQAMVSHAQGKFNESIELALQSKPFFIAANDKEKVIDIINLQGFCNERQAKYEEAGDFYLQSIEQYQLIDDSLGLATTYRNIGRVLSYQYLPKEAERYLLLSTDIFQKLSRKDDLFFCYRLLAEINEDHRKKIEYYLKALEYADYSVGTRNNFFKGLIYNNIGYSYKQLGEEGKVLPNRIKGIEYLKIAVEEAKKSESWYHLKWVYSNLAFFYSTIGEADSCIHYVSKSMDTYPDGNTNEFYQNAYYNLWGAYDLKKDYKNANHYAELAYIYKDSVFQEEAGVKIKENADKYEFEKNQRQITEQQLQIAKTENSRNQILFGGIILLLLVAGLLYRNRKKKQAAEAEANRYRELDRLKSSFFANISHELRTPLTLVSAPLHDALDQVKPSPLKNHLEIAHSNTQKLLRLVNEILDLSKLEAGKVEAKLAEIELLPLIRRLFYAFESIAQIRNLQLEFNTNIPKDLQVQLDAQKFEKIINNLLSNAVKFTENGGKITLNAFQEENHFLFEVIDSGMGISREELPKIFDRFYQSTSESTPLQGGTGIGLSLAKELAQLMNGKLEAESELGQGSRFTLSLSLESDPQIQKAKTRHEVIALDQRNEAFAPSFSPVLLKGQKPRILIIEDNQEMSDYLVASLSAQYHCTKAYDGLEALHLLENDSFDLITCDVMMPNMDGFTLRQRVIQNPKLGNIPFVMLTARSLEEDKLKGLRLGVDDYLTKPFNLNELKARLHNLLSNKIARDNFVDQPDATKEKPITLEEQLLQKAEEYVLQRIDDPQLRIEDMAKGLQLSQRHLSRLLNKYVGMTPVAFILELRLQKARTLLESRQFATVSEVRYEIGIESASYFTRKFTERFGKTPREYLEVFH